MLHSKHHHPPHIFRDDTIYFITARTIKSSQEPQRKLENGDARGVKVSDCRRDSLNNSFKYFYNSRGKDLFTKVLNISKKKFNISIFAWVLLANHYHLLIKIIDRNNLSKFVQNLHSNSARLINNLDNKPKRRIWYNYWDHCIRDEEDFFKHFNYIHNNPIKHRMVKNIEELVKYKYSSFNAWIEKKGREWINSCFEDYPILDFTIEEN